MGARTDICPCARVFTTHSGPQKAVVPMQGEGGGRAGVQGKGRGGGDQQVGQGVGALWLGAYLPGQREVSGPPAMWGLLQVN